VVNSPRQQGDQSSMIDDIPTACKRLGTNRITCNEAPRVIEGIAPRRTRTKNEGTKGLRLRPLRGRSAEPIERLREDARDRLGRLVLNLMPLQHVQQLAVAEDRDGR
jgi:hypothetical protein